MKVGRMQVPMRMYWNNLRLVELDRLMADLARRVNGRERSQRNSWGCASGAGGRGRFAGMSSRWKREGRSLARWRLPTR